MEGALIILAALIVVGFVLWILDKRHPHEEAKPEKRTPEEAAAQQPAQEATHQEDHGPVCCGQHLVCEKDSLSPMSAEIEYYDDEELDRFIGRNGTDYTPEETEEFQEILMTLRPEDVAGWARSITQRHLELPAVVRDELLMLVNEQRNKARAN